MWGHVNDTERVFLMRALWFARNFDTPLPSFDQDIAVAAAGSDDSHGRGTWRNSAKFASRRFHSSATFQRSLDAKGHRQRQSVYGEGLRVHRGRACGAP